MEPMMRIGPTLPIPLANPNPPDPVLRSQFPRESVWQKAVERMFRDCSFLVYHTFNSMRSVGGFPDLVCVHPVTGQTVFAELKTETGIVTDAQAEWLLALAILQYDVFLWRPSDLSEITSLLERSFHEMAVTA